MNLPDPTTPPTAEEIDQAHEPIRSAGTLADLDALRVEAPENPPAILADEDPDDADRRKDGAQTAPLVFVARSAEAIFRSIGIDADDLTPNELAEIANRYRDAAHDAAHELGCDPEPYRTAILSEWEGDRTIRRFGAIAVRIDADPDERTVALEIDRRASEAALDLADRIPYGRES